MSHIHHFSLFICLLLVSLSRLSSYTTFFFSYYRLILLIINLIWFCFLFLCCFTHYITIFLFYPPCFFLSCIISFSVSWLFPHSRISGVYGSYATLHTHKHTFGRISPSDAASCSNGISLNRSLYGVWGGGRGGKGGWGWQENYGLVPYPTCEKSEIKTRGYVDAHAFLHPCQTPFFYSSRIFVQ